MPYRHGDVLGLGHQRQVGLAATSLLELLFAAAFDAELVPEQFAAPAILGDEFLDVKALEHIDAHGNSKIDGFAVVATAQD